MNGGVKGIFRQKNRLKFNLINLYNIKYYLIGPEKIKDKKHLFNLYLYLNKLK